MINNIFQYLYGAFTTVPVKFTARQNYAYEVIDIAISRGSIGGIDITIGGEKVAFLAGQDGIDAVTCLQLGQAGGKSIFNYLRSKGFDVPRIIIGEGETMALASSDNGSTTYEITMIEHYGDALPKNTDKGGSMSGFKLFSPYGTITKSIVAQTTEILKIVSDINPPGYPLFPFSGAVLPKQQFNFLGLVCSKLSGCGADIVFDGVRIWKMNKSILAPDEAFVRPGIFKAVNYATGNELTVFEKPIVFGVNETMQVEVSVANNHATNPENAVIGVIPIMQVVPV